MLLPEYLQQHRGKRYCEYRHNKPGLLLALAALFGKYV
jgi:hypothetical protein